VVVVGVKRRRGRRDDISRRRCLGLLLFIFIRAFGYWVLGYVGYLAFLFIFLKKEECVSSVCLGTR
jgi:hypothetical protein